MFDRIFTNFANAVARWTGRPSAFLVGLALVVLWAIAGPIFNYADAWQLVINTSTTIITFLMVLLIQNTQNRDNAAIQAKLDELIRVTESRNHLIGIEHETDKVIGKVRDEVEQHAEDVDEHLEAADEAAAEAERKAKQARVKVDQAKSRTRARAKAKA